MTSSRRDDAPEEIVAADPSGVPAEPDPAPEANGNGAPRKGRKGAPRGKRGLRLPRRFKKAAPGSAAGIEPHELSAVPGTADLGPHHLRRLLARAGRASQEVQDLPAFIAAHRPEWSVVRWINVDGIGDLGVDPRPRREVPPPPPGHRGRAPRPAAARRCRPTRTDGELPGAALRDRPRAGAARPPAPHRAGQHLRRAQDGAHLPGDARRRLGPGPAAHPDAGVAAATHTTRASWRTR